MTMLTPTAWSLHTSFPFLGTARPGQAGRGECAPRDDQAFLRVRPLGPVGRWRCRRDHGAKGRGPFLALSLSTPRRGRIVFIRDSLIRRGARISRPRHDPCRAGRRQLAGGAPDCRRISVRSLSETLV